jgi:hypothetical protein
MQVSFREPVPEPAPQAAKGATQDIISKIQEEN